MMFDFSLTGLRVRDIVLSLLWKIYKMVYQVYYDCFEFRNVTDMAQVVIKILVSEYRMLGTNVYRLDW